MPHYWKTNDQRMSSGEHSNKEVWEKRKKPVKKTEEEENQETVT